MYFFLFCFSFFFLHFYVSSARPYASLLRAPNVAHLVCWMIIEQNMVEHTSSSDIFCFFYSSQLWRCALD